MSYIENNACHGAPRSTAPLSQFYNVWHSRRALATLDDAALNDIGVTRVDAHTEANRPFWDVPNTWRK